MRRSAGLTAIVAKRLVAFTHRLLEAALGGAADEVVALGV